MTLSEDLASFRYSGPGGFAPGQAPATRVDSVMCGDHEARRYTNHFWTSRQRQGHSLHEVSYRGCFKAELPRFYLDRLTSAGDLAYDPFMGRGTTLLEAALMGCRVAGNDVNPLSRILVRPRLEPPTLPEVTERLGAIRDRRGAQHEIDLSMFYSPATEARLVGLRDYLAERAASGEEDRVDRWIRMVATNRLTGHSPGFFSVYTLPPNQAVSPERQRKINERRKQTPPDRDVFGLIERKTRSLLKDLTPEERASLSRCGGGQALFCQDATDPIPLEPESVKLVVTSPPFLDVVQYASDNWLRCWFNGLDAREIGARITMARTVEAWRETMLGALRALHRVLRADGFVAFEVGEVRSGSVSLDEAVVPVALEAGFDCFGIVVNEQEFTKTAQCWGVDNNAKGTNTNRVVLLTKRTG